MIYDIAENPRPIGKSVKYTPHCLGVKGCRLEKVHIVPVLLSYSLKKNNNDDNNNNVGVYGI